MIDSLDDVPEVAPEVIQATDSDSSERRARVATEGSLWTRIVAGLVARGAEASEAYQMAASILRGGGGPVLEATFEGSPSPRARHHDEEPLG